MTALKKKLFELNPIDKLERVIQVEGSELE